MPLKSMYFNLEVKWGFFFCISNQGNIYAHAIKYLLYFILTRGTASTILPTTSNGSALGITPGSSSTLGAAGVASQHYSATATFPSTTGTGTGLPDDYDRMLSDITNNLQNLGSNVDLTGAAGGGGTSSGSGSAELEYLPKMTWHIHCAWVFTLVVNVVWHWLP